MKALRKWFSLMSIVSFCVSTVGYGWADEGGNLKTARVTLDVKDTDINRVLEAFSQQTGLSVVTGKDVTGAVSARLLNAQWDQALDAVLKSHGFGYERTGDIITVLPIEKIQELTGSQPLRSQVFKLRFRDANDLKPVVASQLSPRGKVEVMEETGQKGWDFGSFGTAGSSAQAMSRSTGGGAIQRNYKGSGDRRSRTKTLVVTDISTVLDHVETVVTSLDTMPQQVLIQARFMEVNRDRLRDLGLDLATGATGTTVPIQSATVPLRKDNGSTVMSFGAQNLVSLAGPAAFGALSADITNSNPFNTGLSMLFRKLSGTQFDILVHALEEDVHTNTLSAPSIVTLDNQEANILVGTQYPILTSSVAGTTTTTTVTSLDYYQDIGVQLRVVPQISGDDRINMIVHPAVSSFTSTLSARSPGGTVLAEYPILITRETETQILMKDGETIVIGGLLKDVKTTGFHRIPILGSIPILGWPFQRRTSDIAKIDLLIFITARIVTEEEVATMTPTFVPPQPGPKSKIRWQEVPASPAESEQQSGRLGDGNGNKGVLFSR